MHYYIFWIHRNKLAMASVILLISAIFAILTTASNGDPNEEVRQLELVHVIMRHGARTPASTYPTDPYINNTFFPIGWGQLTNAGKNQLYETGIFLRQRYGEFLGERYIPDLYYTQSTDVDRTKASMQLVNAGLWPPKGDQVWGPLPWQPIPIHSEPLDEDMLLLVRKPCAQYSLEQERVKNLPEIQTKLETFKKTFKEVSRYTGQKMEDFADAEDVYSTLLAENTFGLKLPDWTKKYFPEQLEKPTIFSYIFNVYTDKLKRLKGGVFLKKLMQDWTAKSQEQLTPKTRKAFLYGGHDSTIVNLLSAFKVWDPQIPGYGITILLEMSKEKKSGEFGIEIFLKNETNSAPHLLTIPGCASFCPLNKLKELTQAVIPENWEEECKSNDPNFTPPPPRGP